MKKHRLNKVFVLTPMIFLSACGYGLKEIYKSDAYNSVDYDKNFYMVWDKGINYHEVEMASESHKLDKINDKVFLSYEDDNFKLLEQGDYSYTDDLGRNEDTKSYSQTFKMSKCDSSFKYGYISKLFDGQLFCHMKYELARVQIKESGFGVRFNKEIKDYSYFALNFKSSLDYRRDGQSTYIPAHKSSIDLMINFYCKSEKGYVRKEFVYTIDNIDTNASENTTIYKFVVI